MFKIKIHPTIEEIVRWLYKLKVWQNGEKSDTPETNKKLLYLMFYFTFFLHNIMCAIQAKDENETFFLMVAGVIIAVTEVRVIHVVGKNKEILGFLYHPLDDDSNEFLQETTSSGRTMNNFMKFVHAYIAAMFVAVILLLIFPMLSATKTLPLFVTYSYDGMFSDIFYYLLYLYVSSELVLSLIFNVTNVLNWYIMLNYSISYEKLGERLKRLGDRKEEPEDSQEATSHCPYFEDLISSTLAHQNIFRYYFKYITGIVAIQANVILFPSSANEFVSVSSNLFMVQMATSSISICLSVYNLAHNSHDDLVHSVVLIYTLLYGIFDIFMVLYLTNEITVESSKLLRRAYESEWIDQTEETKKCFIILCEALKQSQELMILMYPMNLETFTRIINGAYSMFNLLQTLK